MTQEVEGSKPAQIACIVLFGGTGLVMLWVFVAECFEILFQLNGKSAVFDVNKGSLYGLGLGMLGFMLTYVIIVSTMLKKPIKGMSKTITNIGFYSSFAFLIAAPQLIHIPLERHLESQGYFVCREESYTWLFYKHLVYVNNDTTCLSPR